jgi:hypothetical protein
MLPFSEEMSWWWTVELLSLVECWRFLSFQLLTFCWDTSAPDIIFGIMWIKQRGNCTFLPLVSKSFGFACM